jgi:hypothetical protein
MLSIIGADYLVFPLLSCVCILSVVELNLVMLKVMAHPLASSKLDYNWCIGGVGNKCDIGLWHQNKLTRLPSA